jgi:hypothetical protein
VADLLENKTFIEFAVAKPTGLNDLGVPLQESSVVKKGKLHEFSQQLAEGKAGRMYQNLRVTAIKTSEGGIESAKVFISIEAFGDNNVPLAANNGFGLKLCAGTDNLLELVSGSLFLPYANFWYDNRFVFDIPLEVFSRVNRLEFIARQDQVRVI